MKNQRIDINLIGTWAIRLVLVFFASIFAALGNHDSAELFAVLAVISFLFL